MGLFSNFSKKKIESRLKRRIEELLNKPVSDIMSKYVISIPKTTSLEEAGQIIVGEKISCVVVKEDERPVGVVTERDFVKRAPLKAEEFKKLLVSNLMSPKLVTVYPETTIKECVLLLAKNNFRKLVVEDSKSVMRGIITQTDIVRLFDTLYDHLHIKTPDLLNVSDIMTKNIISVHKGSKLQEAKKLMGEKNIGAIIIMNGTKLGGIITEYDLVVDIIEHLEECNAMKVDEVLTYPVITISGDINIFEANRIMIKDNVRRLPIFQDDKLQGIITQTDMCRAIYFFLQKTLNTIKNKELSFEKLEKRRIETNLV